MPIPSLPLLAIPVSQREEESLVLQLQELAKARLKCKMPILTLSRGSLRRTRVLQLHTRTCLLSTWNRMSVGEWDKRLAGVWKVLTKHTCFHLYLHSLSLVLDCDRLLWMVFYCRGVRETSCRGCSRSAYQLGVELVPVGMDWHTMSTLLLHWG